MALAPERAWSERRGGEPPKVPDELVDMLEETYETGGVQEVECNPHDQATRDLIRLGSSYARREGKSFRHQFDTNARGRTIIRFMLRDRRPYTPRRST